MARNRQLAQRSRLVARDTIGGFRRMGDESPAAPLLLMVNLQATVRGERSANNLVINRRNEVEGKAKEHKPSETLAGMGSQFFSTDGIKKMAAWYIDTSEKVANGMLDYQASATEWAKSTALAPIFEAQHDLGTKMVKRSAEVARKLWQLES
jgi:hypothetical protein